MTPSNGPWNGPKPTTSLAGGVLVTGSITLVADARILLGKADA